MTSPSTNASLTLTKRVVTADRTDASSPRSARQTNSAYNPNSALNLTNNSLVALGEDSHSIPSGSPTARLTRSDTIESEGSFIMSETSAGEYPEPGSSPEKSRVAKTKQKAPPKTTSQGRRGSSPSDRGFVEENLSEDDEGPPGGSITFSPNKEEKDEQYPGAKKKSGSRRPSTTPADIQQSGMTSTRSSLPVKVNFGKKEAIGRGSFGIVYKAMDMQSNRMIAVKEITLPPGQESQKQLNLIEREVMLLERMDHPNIVHCLGHLNQQEEHKFLIYMECVSGGTIRSMLRQFGPLHENQASRFTAQVLNGLAYLHGNKVAHRDLKGENLLFDMDGTIKLGDFGAAKELHSTLGNTVAGTAQFMAPEVAKGSTYGLPADIWSLGCCVAEMCTGQSPFISLGKNQFAVMAKIAEIEDIPIPTSVTGPCKDFLRRCLVKDPAKRPTCADLLKMQWITHPPHLDDASAISSSVAVRSSGGNSTGAAGTVEDEKSIDIGTLPSLPQDDTFNPVTSYDSQ